MLHLRQSATRWTQAISSSVGRVPPLHSASKLPNSFTSILPSLLVSYFFTSCLRAGQGESPGADAPQAHGCGAGSHAGRRAAQAHGHLLDLLVPLLGLVGRRVACPVLLGAPGRGHANRRRHACTGALRPPSPSQSAALSAPVQARRGSPQRPGSGVHTPSVEGREITGLDADWPVWDDVNWMFPQVFPSGIGVQNTSVHKPRIEFEKNIQKFSFFMTQKKASVIYSRT